MNELAAVSRNEIIDKPQISVNSLYERWALYIDATEKTTEAYTKAVRLFTEWLAYMNIVNPSRDDIIAYREFLKTKSLKKNKDGIISVEDKGHKPTTIQLYIVALKQFFNWTAQENLYPNITIKVKGAKIDDEYKKDYLTTAQAKQLLNSANADSEAGSRDKAVIALMLTTGLRDISVVNANIEDIKPAGDNMALYYKGKGHDEKAKYVKLAPAVYELINEYLSSREDKEEGQPLFTSVANRNKGGRMTTRSVSRIVKEHLRSIGLDSDRLTAHSLRHTALTQNRLLGGTLEETQQLADHKNISTTMKYDHSLERIKNNSELRIAGALFN